MKEDQMPKVAFAEVEAYASKDTEHAHQVALFMWFAIAKAICSKPAPMTVKYGLDDLWVQPAETLVRFTPWQCLNDLPMAFAIPNGGMRDKITASRLKAEGVRSGVPDVFLPVPKHRLGGGTDCGLFIEMKRPKGARGRKGVIDERQEEWGKLLFDNGYAVATCYSFDEALYALQRYLNQTVSTREHAVYGTRQGRS